MVADALAPDAKTDGSQALRSVGFGGADAGEFVDASGCDSGEGLPRIADKIEYSRFAASEPKLNVGSKINEELNNGSDDGKGSVAAKLMSYNRTPREQRRRTCCRSQRWRWRRRLRR